MRQFVIDLNLEERARDGATLETGSRRYNRRGPSMAVARVAGHIAMRGDRPVSYMPTIPGLVDSSKRYAKEIISTYYRRNPNY